MHKVIIFENHLGERFLLGKDGSVVTSSDLRDYAWTYSSINNKVSDFNRNIYEKSFEVVFHGPQADDNLYSFINMTEKSILYKKRCKLYICDYSTTTSSDLSQSMYIEGYIYANSKPSFLDNHWVTCNFKFVSDTSVWIKEQKVIGGTSRVVFDGLDFPFDYNFDFANPGTSSITNQSLAPADFKIVIYGNDNSRIMFIIGEQTYIINEALAENEIIILDTKAKTITKTDSSGNSTNIFSSRGKTSYIFEKIPSGVNSAYFDGFDWDATIYQERSEPKWI